MEPDEIFNVWYRRQVNVPLREIFRAWNLESDDFSEDELDCNLIEYPQSQIKDWILPHILVCYNILHNKPNNTYEQIIDNVEVWKRREVAKVYREIDN